MNQEEFAQRITVMQNRMYRIACAYLHGEHDRLDAVSQAILHAWEKPGSLRQQQYFDTWLIRILIRECIAIERKEARTLPVASLPEHPAPDTMTDAQLALKDALNVLPEKLRIVMVLHYMEYMEGFSVAEIAHILRISSGAVCSRLSRGRDQMRAWLKEDIE